MKDYETTKVKIELKDARMSEDDVWDAYIWMMTSSGHHCRVKDIEDEELYLESLKDGIESDENS